MFELYTSENLPKIPAHPVISPLLETMTASLVVFAVNGGLDNNSRPFVPETLFSTPMATDMLKQKPASAAAMPAFVKARNTLEALEPTPDNYRTIRAAIDDAAARIDGINQQKVSVMADIEACKQGIENDKEVYTLALAYGDHDKITELESRHESLSQTASTLEKKLVTLDGAALFIPRSQAVLLGGVEKSMVERFRNKRSKAFKAGLEPALKAFKEACLPIIAAYYPSYGAEVQGRLTGELVASLFDLPYKSDSELKDELLSAA